MRIQNIDKIIASVSATLVVEGLKPSNSGMAITCQCLERNITSKQAIERIIELHLKTIANKLRINGQ